MNDIICYEFVDINPTGVVLKSKNSDIYINFDECAKNYASEKSVGMSRCIATRDITKFTFIFYTNPKIKLVFKKHFLKDLFLEKSSFSKFLELQKAINKYGYTTYDLS